MPGKAMTPQISMSPRAWAELLLLAAIWGGSFLSVHIALDEVPVVTVVLHRTLWAALILWAVVLARGIAIPRTPRIWLAFLAMGFLNNVVPFGLMVWAQLHVETGLTSILNATTAVFGVLVAALVFRDEKLTTRRALGVGLGFAGVATAIGVSALAQLDLRSTAQLAILAGTLSYACGSAFARAHLGHLPPQIAAAGMLTGSSVILLPVALVWDGPMAFDLSARTYGALAYLSLVATAGAYLLYYRVLAMAGSGNLMLVTLLIPPVAILLGALVLDETLPAHAYLGFALLSAGLLILNGRGFRRRN